MDERRHCTIVATETGFYLIDSVPMKEFGDSEGFFTKEEISKIGEVFSKTDNPSISRNKNEIKYFEYNLLSKSLSEERFNEYKKIRWSNE